MVLWAILRCVAFPVLGIALTWARESGAADVPWKIDVQTAQRLVAEAYDHGIESKWFDFDPGMSHRFFEFDGINQSGNGSFGFFAVNPWTGDVWALWGCHKLLTPALRKSQAEIRRRFAGQDLKRYVRLSRLKPACATDD